MENTERLDLTGGGLCRSRRGWLSRVGTVRSRDRWAFDERVLGSSEFVQQVLADSENGGGRGALQQAPQDPAIVSEVLRRAAVVCGTSPEAIASPSHEPAAVAGRALVCCVAVLHLGLSANAVAGVLGVSRYSVRRGLNRSAHVFAALGCTPAHLTP